MPNEKKRVKARASLVPLTLGEALRGAMRVDPAKLEPEKARKRKRRKKYSRIVECENL